MTRNTGYTLLEILIVLAISSTIFAVGYTGFREFARRQTLNAAVNSVKADLSLTVKQALDGKKPATCTGGLENYAFNITSTTTYTISASCDTAVVGVNTVLVKSVTLPLGITLTTPFPNPLEFKTLGQGTNITAGNSATLTISNAKINYSQTLIIGANGEIN